MFMKHPFYFIKRTKFSYSGNTKKVKSEKLFYE
jgi:hypothetical protein